MSSDPAPNSPSDPAVTPHQRRPRYAGKHPRHFADKYKELDPTRDPATAAKVVASGRTLAGSHRPIMVTEILAVLAPRSGAIAADCTLGYGGHAQEILARLLPGGRLLGLDADPLELPRTEARLRAQGYGPEVFTVHHGNFAGLPRVLADAGLPGVDLVVADLGVSSMQIDDPARGFSVKLDGPLDMRMNPQHGRPASALLASIRADALAQLLTDHADEPQAATLAPLLAGRTFSTTNKLADAIREATPLLDEDESDLTIRRFFQALRIAVNDEFSALETFLRNLPGCLNPGGRVAILTFHSGEDRRVKKAFTNGLRDGSYSECAAEVGRASPAERHANPRSISAKLRWARRSDRS